MAEKRKSRNSKRRPKLERSPTIEPAQSSLPADPLRTPEGRARQICELARRTTMIRADVAAVTLYVPDIDHATFFHLNLSIEAALKDAAERMFELARAYALPLREGGAQ